MRWRGVLSRLARVSSKRQTIAPDIGARLAEQVTWGTRFLITTNLCFYGLVESGRVMHQSIVAQLSRTLLYYYQWGSADRAQVC